MASELEVCRVCLATDLKMYSLQNGILKTCVQAIASYWNNFNCKDLPQYVCYICAAHLMKYYNFVERSLVSQTTLLDIFAFHGTITKSLVRSRLKSRPEYQAPALRSHKITPSNVFDFKYDDGNHTSILISTQSLTQESLKREKEIATQNSLKEELESDECKVEDTLVLLADTTADSDFDSEDDKALVSTLTKYLSGEDTVFVAEHDEGVQTQITKTRKKSERKKGDKSKSKKGAGQRKGPDDLSPDERLMQDHFNIVILTLEEQISEWKEINRVRSEGKKHTCEVCGKSYTQESAYKTHMAGHDPDRGPSSCPVCKLRYKSDVLVRSHVKFSHSKKFHCKACPRTFNTLCMAKRHYKWHCGQVYRCAQCAFSTQHEALLSKHVRRRHAVRHACATCGHGFTSSAGLRLHCAKAHGRVGAEAEASKLYKCEECDLAFTSEDARRVHLLTSFQHKKKRNMYDPSPLDPIARRTCKSCGAMCGSLPELAAHVRAIHPKAQARAKGGAGAPQDAYPANCEHCLVTLSTRKEHWAHVRQHHPKERASYRPLIAAVCDTCGKGFQNTTKLQLHELRHASPTVRCEFCDKLFYDKFRLSDHLSIHREAFPHRCRTCGRGFKAQANLTRHYKTHTDIASYECTLCGKMFKYSTSLNLHVRSVHYKIPPPPRKKRARTKNAAAAPVSVGLPLNGGL